MKGWTYHWLPLPILPSIWILVFLTKMRSLRAKADFISASLLACRNGIMFDLPPALSRVAQGHGCWQGKKELLSVSRLLAIPACRPRSATFDDPRLPLLACAYLRGCRDPETPPLCPLHVLPVLKHSCEEKLLLSTGHVCDRVLIWLYL